MIPAHAPHSDAIEPSDPLAGHLDAFADAILERRRSIAAPNRATLVAITGIDASGKGVASRGLQVRLRARGVRVAAISADMWLNLPEQRFDPARPGDHFYRHAIRFDSLFRDVVLPLQATRSCRAAIARVDETSAVARPHLVTVRDVDVILLEGIFLLKRSQRAYFDVSAWLECSFETALERAVRRGQEGLAPDATRRAYETIYFPAQRIHIAADAPQAAADRVVPNDHRLAAAGAERRSA